MTPARPLLLDLFCGAGGAAVGYHRAGFDVLGVDLKPQPNYPFRFEQADALEYLREEMKMPGGLRVAAVHASPPCQAHTSLKSMHNARRHADLVAPTRDLLRESGLPFIIENVVGAPLIAPTLLCGTMFGLGVEDAELRRHRLFESSIPLAALACSHGQRDTIGVYGVRNRRRARVIGVYGEACRDSRRKFDKGVPDFTVVQGRVAMGIDWMTLAELSQAIPPAYTEFLGRQLLAHLEQRAVA